MSASVEQITDIRGFVFLGGGVGFFLFKKNLWSTLALDRSACDLIFPFTFSTFELDSSQQTQILVNGAILV